MTLALRFAHPTSVHLHAGALDDLGAIVADHGHRALLLTGGGSCERNGALSRVVDQLDAAGVWHVHCPGISTNPAVEAVVEAAQLATDARADVVVALGGGSVIDAGKAVALAMSHPGDLWEYRVTGTLSVPAIERIRVPVVAVPTLAGTGTEVSPAFLLCQAGLKEVFYSPWLFPSAAVADPTIMATAPPALVAAAGVDALVQGLEAFVSTNATELSDIYAREAMARTAAWLKPAVAGDEAAHAQLALAAILSLYAVSQAGVGAIHALSNPLSGRLGLHHGEALAILAPAVVEANWDARPARFLEVASVLGLDGVAAGDRDPATYRAALSQWLQELGLPARRLPIPASELVRYAEEAQNPDLATNPVPLEQKAIVELYKSISEPA